MTHVQRYRQTYTEEDRETLNFCFNQPNHFLGVTQVKHSQTAAAEEDAQGHTKSWKNKHRYAESKCII